MVIFPYSTDVHDGRIRLAALQIIGLCLLVHLLVTADERRINHLIQKTQTEWQIEQVSKYSESETGTKDQLDAMLEMLRNPSESSSLQSLRERINEVRKTSLMHRLGLVLADFKLHNLFTSMFTHAGWMHLIGNMLMFYVVGLAMEQYWGYWRFMVIYLVCGLAADGAFMITAASIGEKLGNVPLIGASGAIAGMMGAFLVTHTRVNVKMFYAFGFWYRGVFPLPAYVYFGFWFFQQVFSALFFAHSSGVAYTAHIGGFIMGAVIGRIIKSEDDASVVDPHLARRHRNSELAAADKTIPKGFYYQLPQDAKLTLDDNDSEMGKDELPSGVSSEEAGWQALERGETQEAQRQLQHAMSVYLQDTTEYRARIVTLVEKLIQERKLISFSTNEYYQWGKQLENIPEYRHAIACYDLAAINDFNSHIGKNSLIAAATLRIKTGFQFDRVQRDMNFIISQEPDGIAADRAKEVLQMMPGMP